MRLVSTAKQEIDTFNYEELSTEKKNAYRTDALLINTLIQVLLSKVSVVYLFNVGLAAGRVPNTAPTSTDIGILEL